MKEGDQAHLYSSMFLKARVLSYEHFGQEVWEISQVWAYLYGYCSFWWFAFLRRDFLLAKKYIAFGPSTVWKLC